MHAGGAGFIASHVVRILVKKYPQYKVKCLTCPFLESQWELNSIQNLKSMQKLKALHADHRP